MLSIETESYELWHHRLLSIFSPASAVILMEGGTDFDLQILDPNYKPETMKPKAPEPPKEEKTEPAKE